MKLRIPRKQNVESDGIDVVGVEKEGEGARKVAAFGKMSDKRGGEEGVEDMAGFEEKGVGLVGDLRGGERKRAPESLRMEVLSYQLFYGGRSVKVKVGSS